MDAKISKRADMTLIGLAITVTLREVQSEKSTYALASTFMRRQAEIRICSNPKEVFGLSTDPRDYKPDADSFEDFIGVEAASGQSIPEGMVLRLVPANTYVIFTFKSPAENAGGVHGYLYSTWLKESDFELCGRYNIEIYDERNYGPDSEESLTDILFPIRRKQTAP